MMKYQTITDKSYPFGVKVDVSKFSGDVYHFDVSFVAVDGKAYIDRTEIKMERPFYYGDPLGTSMFSELEFNHELNKEFYP